MLPPPPTEMCVISQCFIFDFQFQSICMNAHVWPFQFCKGGKHSFNNVQQFLWLTTGCSNQTLQFSPREDTKQTCLSGKEISFLPGQSKFKGKLLENPQLSSDWRLSPHLSTTHVRQLFCISERYHGVFEIQLALDFSKYFHISIFCCHHCILNCIRWVDCIFSFQEFAVTYG